MALAVPQLTASSTTIASVHPPVVAQAAIDSKGWRVVLPFCFCKHQQLYPATTRLQQERLAVLLLLPLLPQEATNFEPIGNKEKVLKTDSDLSESMEDKLESARLNRMLPFE